LIVSCFRTVGLLAALAALAIGLGACGGSEGPEEVLDSASLAGLESGGLDLSLSIKSGGRQDESLDVSLSGPFQTRGPDLPLVDLTATAKGTAAGEPVDLEGGLTLLSNRGYITYKGVKYEIDPSNFRFVTSSFLPRDPGQGKGGNATALSACLEAAASLGLGKFIDNLVDEGNADVDGASTTKISGDLDVSASLDAIAELARQPSCDAQLMAADWSAEEVKGIVGELTGAAKVAHLEIYVGDDDIVRKITGELKAAAGGGGREKVEANFELTLSQVNEGPEIKAPAAAKPILLWFQTLGAPPFEALFLVSEPDALGRVLALIAADTFPAAGD
jgi:hypothetical protein